MIASLFWSYSIAFEGNRTAHESGGKTNGYLRLKSGALICLAVLLAGCARFQPEPVSPAATAVALEARRLSDPGLERLVRDTLGENSPKHTLAHGTPEPPHPSPLPQGGEGGKQFPDVWDEQSLTLAAFYFHPSLDVARAEWRLAEAGVRTAGGRPNPTLAATPAFNSSTPASSISPWLTTVTLDVPIETAGKRSKRILEAEKTAESARWNLVSTAWQVRSNLRSALWLHTVAGKRAELLRAQASIQKQVIQLLQQRVDVGEISRPELTLVQIASHKTQLALAEAEQKAAEARVRLAESIGVSAAALEGVKLEYKFAGAADDLASAEARRVALQSRSDILAALADYAAAEAGLRLQIAKQYPDIHLNPGYEFDQGDNKWSLGLTIELPILNQNQGPIAEAEARRKLSAAKFTALQAQVIGEIDRALELWRAARKQKQSADELQAAAQKQTLAVEAQAKAGAADNLDVANAQLELNQAALTQLETAAQVQLADGALESALQRPDALIMAAISDRSEKSEPHQKSMQ